MSVLLAAKLKEEVLENENKVLISQSYEVKVNSVDEVILRELLHVFSQIQMKNKKFDTFRYRSISLIVSPTNHPCEFRIINEATVPSPPSTTIAHRGLIS